MPAPVVIPPLRGGLRGIPNPPNRYRVRQFATGSGNNTGATTLPRLPLPGSVLIGIGSQPSQTGTPTPSGGGVTWVALSGFSNSGNQQYTLIWLGIVGSAPSAAVTWAWTGQGCGIVAELIGTDALTRWTAAANNTNTATAAAERVVLPYGLMLAACGSRAALTATGTPAGFRQVATVSNASGSKAWLGQARLRAVTLPAATFTSSGTSGIGAWRGVFR